MPYITSIERIGIKKGIEQSQEQMKQVLLESLELGLDLKFGSVGLNLLPEISLIQNVELLREIQKLLKITNTVEELIRQIALKTIEFRLEQKFGSVGLNLLPEISEIQNVELLREIQEGLERVNTVEELRQIF